MRRNLTRVLASAVAVFAVATLSTVTAEAGTHTNYPLGRHALCRTGYVKRIRLHWVHVRGQHVKRHYLDCVWRPRTTAPLTGTSPQSVTLNVSIDPNYVQSASNPLLVSWSFSIAATSGGQALAEPPAGTVKFYSDGQLVQSTSVGGSVSGGVATTLYASFGLHDVEASYVSGSESASTGKESFDIVNTGPASTPPSTCAPSKTPHGSESSKPGHSSSPSSPSKPPAEFRLVAHYHGLAPTPLTCIAAA